MKVVTKSILWSVACLKTNNWYFNTLATICTYQEQFLLWFQQTVKCLIKTVIVKYCRRDLGFFIQLIINFPRLFFTQIFNCIYKSVFVLIAITFKFTTIVVTDYGTSGKWCPSPLMLFCSLRPVKSDISRNIKFFL